MAKMISFFSDLFRRQVDIKERVFLMEKGVVTEGQADLGGWRERERERESIFSRDLIQI